MMAIADYLNEVEFAADSLVTTIWRESNRLEELESQLISLSKLVVDNYDRAEFIQSNAEDPDDLMMGVGAYWDNYFGEDKERYYKQEEKEELEEQVAAHTFSVGSLSGALLQHAKQGISLAHGKPVNWPNGRYIGSQPLKQVVLQARNQSIHWEEQSFNPQVEHCFNTLAKEVSPKFANYTNQNMAFDILDLLGWKDFASFRKDMLLFV